MSDLAVGAYVEVLVGGVPTVGVVIKYYSATVHAYGEDLEVECCDVAYSGGVARRVMRAWDHIRPVSLLDVMVQASLEG